MKFEIKKSFLKDLKKINDNKLAEEVKSLFNTIEKADNLQDIPNIKKLRGYEEFYRIRVGRFRVGIKYKNNEVTFIRILPRKDIYKFFP
jgi:mRNA interferase RelE/StbE